MEMKALVKTRVEWFHDFPWYEWQGDASSQPTNLTNRHQSYASQELLTSTGHPLRGLGKYDVGGSFHCIRREHEFALHGPVHNRTSSDDSNINSYNYKGYYFALGTAVTNEDFGTPVIATNSMLDALGTTAIARVIPTNPLAGLTVALAELRREGIPHLIGAEALRERCLRARNAGSEYLNYEFGWRPLVKDVLSLADAIINSDELMRRYERESGKRLHRAYTFPWQTSTTHSQTGGLRAIPTIKTGYSTATGIQHRVQTVRTRRWFEGTFTYHLAPQGTLARKEQLAAKRLGLRITPEVLWNLTPWSWAADWVSNMGDVIHNVSAFANDGLVMPWAYMMQETSITNEYTFSGSRLTRTGEEVSARQKLTVTRKQRRKATPFGFGLNLTGFSGRQWAILSALGLARGRGQMS